MLPDRVSKTGPLTYESGALPIALRGPATHRMTNSVGSDQTAPLEQSDLDLHCLLKPTCPNT